MTSVGIFSIKTGSTMVNILDRLGSLHDNTDTALGKEKAVYSLWKIQEDADLIFDRAMQCKCIDELLAQTWRQEINTIRQYTQDSFLLARSTEIVKEKSQATISEFQKIVESYISRIIQLERNMSIETRVKRINDGFVTNFDLLARQQVIGLTTKQELYNQLKIYAESLTKNINDFSLRSSIKNELLHSLVDDFHRDVYIIYRKAMLTKKRI
jgi:hypothetical protein